MVYPFVISVSKNFSAEEDSVILRMLQAVAVPVIGNVCHVFMNGLNRIQVCLDVVFNCCVFENFFAHFKMW